MRGLRAGTSREEVRGDPNSQPHIQIETDEFLSSVEIIFLPLSLLDVIVMCHGLVLVSAASSTIRPQAGARNVVRAKPLHIVAIGRKARKMVFK